MKLKSPAMFPPEIATILRRSDITFYSPSGKQGIFIELTVLAEENIGQANFRKKMKKKKKKKKKTSCTNI